MPDDVRLAVALVRLAIDLAPAALALVAFALVADAVDRVSLGSGRNG